MLNSTLRAGVSKTPFVGQGLVSVWRILSVIAIFHQQRLLATYSYIFAAIKISPKVFQFGGSASGCPVFL